MNKRAWSRTCSCKLRMRRISFCLRISSIVWLISISIRFLQKGKKHNFRTFLYFHVTDREQKNFIDVEIIIFSNFTGISRLRVCVSREAQPSSSFPADYFRVGVSFPNRASSTFAVLSPEVAPPNACAEPAITIGTLSNVRSAFEPRFETYCFLLASLWIQLFVEFLLFL